MILQSYDVEPLNSTVDSIQEELNFMEDCVKKSNKKLTTNSYDSQESGGGEYQYNERSGSGTSTFTVPLSCINFPCHHQNINDRNNTKSNADILGYGCLQASMSIIPDCSSGSNNNDDIEDNHYKNSEDLNGKKYSQNNPFNDNDGYDDTNKNRGTSNFSTRLVKIIENQLKRMADPDMQLASVM